MNLANIYSCVSRESHVYCKIWLIPSSAKTFLFSVLVERRVKRSRFLAKSENTGIIVCKYFNEIHSELLDSFYSYMQTLTNIKIDLKFILLTEEISFIPDNILNAAGKVVRRPSLSDNDVNAACLSLISF